VGARNNNSENIMRECIQERAFDRMEVIAEGDEKPKKQEREHIRQGR
jgi:hypothetical protein